MICIGRILALLKLWCWLVLQRATTTNQQLEGRSKAKQNSHKATNTHRQTHTNNRSRTHARTHTHTHTHTDTHTSNNKKQRGAHTTPHPPVVDCVHGLLHQLPCQRRLVDLAQRQRDVVVGVEPPAKYDMAQRRQAGGANRQAGGAIRKACRQAHTVGTSVEGEDAASPPSVERRQSSHSPDYPPQHYHH
jgi:hypothetical protein